MAGVAALPDSRERLYAGLMRRNRVVAALRWLVPAAGVAVLLFVIGAMVLDVLSHRFGFSNIRIDRDNLVVETPKLTSTDDDGTLYALSARAARVRPTQTDLIDMEGVVFSMTPTTGPAVEAAAEAGQFQVSDQLLNVPGVTHISTTEGLNGTLEAVFADLMNWKMVASGTVDFTLPNGSHLVSDGMTYDRATGIYTFTRASVTLVSTPGETP